MSSEEQEAVWDIRGGSCDGRLARGQGVDLPEALYLFYGGNGGIIGNNRVFHPAGVNHEGAPPANAQRAVLVAVHTHSLDGGARGFLDGRLDWSRGLPGIRGLAVHLNAILEIDVESHGLPDVPEFHIIIAADIVGCHLYLLPVYIDRGPGRFRHKSSGDGGRSAKQRRSSENSTGKL